MDLGLTIEGDYRPAQGTWVRDLGPADLALFEAAPRIKQELHAKRLTMRHHALARSIARDEDVEAAALTSGYTLGNARQIVQSPAFKELVEHYRGLREAELVDPGAAKMALLHQQAAEELLVRLEDEPEAFSHDQLRKVMTDTADRIGLGPRTTNTNVNLHVNVAARMQEARKRLKTIEHQP